MQLFISNSNLRIAAKNLDNKRLNKQIIEGCQILSTVLWMTNCGVAETLCSQGQIYLPTHEHHPVVKWGASCRLAYNKTLVFIDNCLWEYKERFKKEHSSRKRVDCLWSYCYLLENNNWTDWQNFTTNHKHIKDVYEAYTLCLKEKQGEL